MDDLSAGRRPVSDPEQPFRVSVVLPTRNRLDSLRQALASLARQSYRNFEVWLVNDASSDDTDTFVRAGNLQRAYPGIPSIHVLTNATPRGAAASRNRALRRSAGEYIAFLDDDDEWLPDYLERQVAGLDAHPEALAAFANHVELGDDGVLRVPDVQPLFDYPSPLVRLLTEAFVHSMSVVVCRRCAVDSVGLMDAALAIVHDWEWYARLLLAGGAILELGGPALVRRKGPGGLVTDHREWYREERRVIDALSRQDPVVARSRQQILAYRSLFFARTAVRRGDHAYAARRLAESFARAPVRALRIASRRHQRRGACAP